MPQIYNMWDNKDKRFKMSKTTLTSLYSVKQNQQKHIVPLSVLYSGLYSIVDTFG